MSSISIPPHFHEAAHIFLQELETHAEKFRQAIEMFETGEHPPAATLKDLVERAHLIRGGAGFLNLQELQLQAKDAEIYFKSTAPNDNVKAVLSHLKLLGETVLRNITLLHAELDQSSPPG